nr:hypothetical protein GCM10020092_021160 [Actinoplanes digitatis]
MLAAEHLDTSLTEPGVARAVVGGAGYLALVALLGLGLGTVVRHTAGGIAAVFGVLLGPQMLTGLLPTGLADDVYGWLPSPAGLAVTTVRPDSALLPPWAGAAVFSLYIAIAMCAGCLVPAPPRRLIGGPPMKPVHWSAIPLAATLCIITTPATPATAVPTTTRTTVARTTAAGTTATGTTVAGTTIAGTTVAGTTVAGTTVAGTTAAGTTAAGTTAAGTTVAGTTAAGTTAAGTTAAGTTAAGTAVAGRIAWHFCALGPGDAAGAALDRAGC